MNIDTRGIKAETEKYLDTHNVEWGTYKYKSVGISYLGKAFVRVYSTKADRREIF